MPNSNRAIVVVDENQAITATNQAGPIEVHQTEVQRLMAQIDPNRITPAMQAIINADNAENNPDLSANQVREAKQIAMAQTFIEVQRQQRG